MGEEVRYCEQACNKKKRLCQFSGHILIPLVFLIPSQIKLLKSTQYCWVRCRVPLLTLDIQASSKQYICSSFFPFFCIINISFEMHILPKILCFQRKCCAFCLSVGLKHLCCSAFFHLLCIFNNVSLFSGLPTFCIVQ